MKHFYQTKNNLSDVISIDNYFPFAEVITLHELKVHASRNYKVFNLNNVRYKLQQKLAYLNK